MNEAVGSFILIIIIILAAMLFQSGRIQEWFDPGEVISVLLPSEGLYGLGEGADVDILGTRAGEVQRIVIDPDKRMHAQVQIRRDFVSFVRVDSRAIIRKRFGVAGDSFLDITRGEGEQMDWKLAVIEARADKAPTETLQVILEELRTQIQPVLRDVGEGIKAWKRLADSLNEPEGDLAKLVANLSSVTGKLDKGEGSVGRLITDDTLLNELEGLVGNLRASLGRMSPVFEDMQKISINIKQMTAGLSLESKTLPDLTRQITDTLGNLSSILGDLNKTTKDLPRITKNIGEATQGIPSLVLQSHNTLLELEKLIKQLQSHWLIGKGAGPQTAPTRITPKESGW